jgi:hypothetical protein
MREASAASSSKAPVKQSEAHACSFYCDHK